MDTFQHCCCFTGHRPNRYPWLGDPEDLRTRALCRALWERIQYSHRQGYTCFLSGMAQGVDLLCAQLVLQLQEEDPEVRLIPVLPYPGQANRWPAAERREYRRILQACQEELIIVSPRYSRDCFRKRNHYLVEHASKVIGVYDGNPTGGTHQTLEYAKQRGLEMELLMPG
ncbi:MAG: SLOG family protein [Candidatus Onthomonas sp.]